MSVIAAQMNNAQCSCICHNDSIPRIKTYFPYVPCCPCQYGLLGIADHKGSVQFSGNQISVDELNNMKQEMEEDVSPMVKQMQVLERRIAELEDSVKFFVKVGDFSEHDEHIHDLKNIEAEKRLISLEKRIALLETDKERLIKLEKHKIYQIDENRKESKRLDEVEMFGASNSDAIEELAKKVDCFQDWQNRFLDEIGALSVKVNQQNSSLREFEKQRIDPKLEEMDKTIHGVDSRVCFALDGIENKINGIIKNYNEDVFKKIKELEERIGELSNGHKGNFQDINNLHAEVLRLEKKLNTSKSGEILPHQCPVCNGMCKFNVFGQDKTVPCLACEGEGIVWG